MKIISRKALSLLLTLAMVFSMAPFSSMTAFADSSIKKMYYNGSGLWKDSNCTDPVDNRAEYTALEVKSDVTTIPDGYFSGCTALTSVTIPSRVTSIGYSAFSDLQNLKDVTVMGNASILDYAFSYCPALTNITMPNVTSLANCAFSECRALTGITLPSVTSIDGSFYNCTALTSVTAPNVVSVSGGAFSGCIALTNVTMLNVTSIDDAAFDHCTSLANVTLPNVTSIGKEVFIGCSSLTSVTLPKATSVSTKAFFQCEALTSVTMPNVKSIDTCAFYDCEALTGVSLPSVTSIGDSAFSCCKALTSAVMPNVAVIGDGAFYGSSLTSAVMPNVTSVANGAFQYCEGLNDVTMPSTASVDSHAFDDCHSLNNLYVLGGPVPSGMPEIANTFLFTRYQADGQSYYKLTGYTCTGTGMQIPTDFSGIQIQPPINKNDIKITDKIAYCNGTGLYTDEKCTIPVDSSSKFLLTKIVFSSGITAIGDRMFDGCTDLTTVTIPTSVTSIGEGAFNECRNLKDVTILGAASIGEDAFDICDALTSITMPNVTSIGRDAFYHCGALTSVTMPSVTSIDEDAFRSCENLTCVIMPKVTTIRCEAFVACPALTTVAFKAKADTIEECAFWISESGTVTFVVPAETKAYYEALLNSDVMGPIKATVISGELVTAFDALPSGTATQSVANGTAQAALTLPADLNATADGVKETIHNVTWAPAAVYDATAAGTNTFTAVMPSGYILAGGAVLPTITVNVAAASGSSDHHSDNSTRSEPAAPTVEITTANTASSTVTTVTAVPDSAPTVSGSQSNVSVTIPADVSSTITSATPKKPVEVKITVPTASLVEQLSSSAVQTVDLTVKVPAAVANNTNTSATVSIKAEQTVLQAAKDAKKDVTLSVINSETGKEAYSWTFKGSDLAASTAEVKSVDLALSVQPTTFVPSVNTATQNNKGLVLSFANNGVLPSAATVKINVAGQGYKPGQAVYFYYYNPTTKALEQVGSSAAYTVDANGFVSITITHCSDYVLLPKAARSLTLDTKTYTVAPQKSYEIGVKLTGANGMPIKAYSSNIRVAVVTKLKNGNYKVTALKPGVTYIMFDVYDEKSKLIPKAHASVRLNVVNHAKSNGDSARQVVIF